MDGKMTFLPNILPLTAVMSLRFFGLFIILPTISLHANSLHASSFALGLVIGLTYFTQFIFQTPFGALSDRFNRNFVIIFGLLIFIAGSLICALSDDIFWLIFGRGMQGVGAIGGVVSAKITDLSPEEKRTKAMALMGGGIFCAFLGSMMLGPVLSGLFGERFLFFLAAFCSFIAVVIMFFVPNSPHLTFQNNKNFSSFKAATLNKNLFIMNLSSFLEKALMTLVFVAVPLIWTQKFSLDPKDLWKIYLPSGVLGMIAMAPASIFAEKYHRPKLVMTVGICCFLVAFALFSTGGFGALIAGILVFFTGFATLEPIMQSLVSKFSKASFRGLALGNFTSAAYLGSFVGAFLGSAALKILGLSAIAFIVAMMCVLWLVLIKILENLGQIKTLYFHQQPGEILKIHENMEKNPAIFDHYVNENEKILVVKFDNARLSKKDVMNAIVVARS